VGLAEAASAHTVSWWVSHRAGLAARQREVAEVEARSVRLWNFQPVVVPGLLQTAEYARRVLALVDVSGQRDVAAAAARLERQAVLYDEGAGLRRHPPRSRALAPTRLDPRPAR
jgi:Domain of unknown function (DUF5753)